MTAQHEQQAPSAPKETKESLIPPEDFVRKLYEETKKWLIEEKDAEIIARFDSSNLAEWGYRIPARLLSSDFSRGESIGEDIVFPEIQNWDAAEGRHASTVFLPLELEEGLVLRNQYQEYGLVLGKRNYRHMDSGLSFQFGYFNQDKHGVEKNVGSLHLLAHSNINLAASGGFSIMQGRGPLWIDIEGRLNSWHNGGSQISDSKDNPIRTETGFKKSMDFIKDTLTRGHRSPNLK